LITDFLSLYALDKGFFEFDESMMKIDLFVFGGGFASLPYMLNQVVDVEGLLDSKTFMDHRIDCVRFVCTKGV
jgi:chromate transporter